MKSWVQILVSAAILISALGIEDVQGGSDEWKKWHGHQNTFKCSGMELKLEPSFHTIMESCRNQSMEAWIASGKKEKLMSKHVKTCNAICLGKELGLIDASGKIVRDVLMKLVVEVFPASKTEELKGELDTCIDEYGTGISNNAGNCSSAMEFLRCGSARVFKICEYIPAFIMQHPDGDDE